MPQCAGITKSGKQCSREANKGSKTCWQHIDKPSPVYTSVPKVHSPALAPVPKVYSPVPVPKVYSPARVPLQAGVNKVSDNHHLDDLPVELQLIILKDMKISDLLEIRLSSRTMKSIIDDIINERAKESFSFTERYTIEEKIHKLKTNELFNVLINTDNFIYELFLTLASGHMYYINKSSGSFNPEMNFKAKIMSSMSSDQFYKFVERNINKFDILNLTKKDIYEHYKSLFIKDKYDNNVYLF